MGFCRRAAWGAAFLATGALALPDGPYVNSALRFGFTPPVGWKQKRHPDAIVVFVETLPAPPSAGPMRSQETNEQFLARMRQSLNAPQQGQSVSPASILVLSRHAEEETLEQYARETRAKLTRSRTSRLLRERQRRLGGLPAIERTILLRSPGQPPLQTREVICLQGKRLFTLALTSPQTTFQKNAREFEKTAASFVWRN